MKSLKTSKRRKEDYKKPEERNANLRVKFNMEENIQEAKQTKLYVDASWRVRKERSRTRNPNKKIQGKAINFFGEELLSWRRIVWRKGYSGECCERNRTKKFKGKQTEGKWKQKGKKTTMQINNEEWKKERWIY